MSTHTAASAGWVMKKRSTMAGFFALTTGSSSGGTNYNQPQLQVDDDITPPSPENLFVYHRNNNQEEKQVTYRYNNNNYKGGLELWHHQDPLLSSSHCHQYQGAASAPIYLSSSSSVGGARCNKDNNVSAGESAGPPDFNFMLKMRRGGAAGEISCQDCGNQAKKECMHMRCRTCCKSRGFECQTHVKSSWIPASKRRELRQQQQLSLLEMEKQQQKQRHLAQVESCKRMRQYSKSDWLTDHSSATGLELGGNVPFPGEVNTEAVFQCLRVSSVENATAMKDEQYYYGYQTAVSIGGHLFKGILYDQGEVGLAIQPAASVKGMGDGSSPSSTSISSGGSANRQQGRLHLTTAHPDRNAGADAYASVSGAATIFLHPSASASLPTAPYPPIPLNTFMAGGGGTQLFPLPRS